MTGLIASSSSALVLVDHATEDVLAANRPALAVLSAWIGHGELQASVRPGLVVVTQVLAKHPLKLTARQDQEVVQAVLSGGPHPALGDAFATGVCTGVRTTLMPVEAMTASKLAVNFVSRSRTRKRNGCP